MIKHYITFTYHTPSDSLNIKYACQGNVQSIDIPCNDDNERPLVNMVQRYIDLMPHNTEVTLYLGIYAYTIYWCQGHYTAYVAVNGNDYHVISFQGKLNNSIIDKLLTVCAAYESAFDDSALAGIQSTALAACKAEIEAIIT